MKKVLGWLILISSIVILATIGISNNWSDRIWSFCIGFNGIFNAIELILSDKRGDDLHEFK